MESINNIEEISSLKENKIIGNPSLQNSNIVFNGSGNILYCENNVKLLNSNINFAGDNSLIYLSSSKTRYVLNALIFYDSVIYFGKENNIASDLNINVQEHQNVIIGDDCIFGPNTNIRTADAHIIYDGYSKKRISFSSSTLIGDHVWIGHQSYISKSVIGSGAIIGNNSHVPSNSIIKSNTLNEGNPVNIIKENVFFTNENVGPFTSSDSHNFDEYSSRIYLFKNVPGETLDFDKINELLFNFDINHKIEFIQKLFIQNKKHNRFSI